MKRNILLKIYCRQVDNRVIFHASLVHGTVLVFIYPILSKEEDFLGFRKKVQRSPVHEIMLTYVENQ
jgi:hypothetical protein